MNTSKPDVRNGAAFTLPFLIATLIVALISPANAAESTRTSDEPPKAKIKLIYDGDIGPDPCDFSTLSMLHQYHNKGMIDLIGVIGETPDPYLASTFSIYNQLYGNNIPIGAFNGKSGGVKFPLKISLRYKWEMWFNSHQSQNKAIYEKFGNDKTKSADDVLHSVAMYRRLLSEAQDNSITIYAAGQLYNFPALFESGSDQYSTHSGLDLLKQKVKEFVIMGGWFPTSSESPWYGSSNGAEYNWWALGQKNVTKTTIETLVAMEKPITYVGAEQGPRILVGKELTARLGRNHPTTEAYYLFKRIAKVPDHPKGAEPVLKFDNPAFDEIALFYAVEGVGKYFKRVRGRIHIDEHGANTWIAGEGNENYLSIRIGTEPELREIITDRITGDF
jgi:inosine-uridine nucleoside N-ribohydrolase